MRYYATRSFSNSKYYRSLKRYGNYVIHGALFYYICDEYGDRTSDPPIFIQRVPDHTDIDYDTVASATRLREQIAKHRYKMQRCSDEHQGYAPPTFGVKRQFYQPPLSYIEKGNQT